MTTGAVQEPTSAPRPGRFARLLDALWAGEEDATALGLCRVALVTVFTLSLLTHLGAVGEYFSDESMVAGEHARQAFKSRWSLFFWLPDPTWVRALFGVGVVAHLMWLVGLYTRVAALVAAAIWISMVGRNPLLYSMPDQLHTCLLFLLALMPAGRGVSLDARWRGKGGAVPIWCRRVLQLQMAVVYTTTGLLKSGVTWQREGTAIYYALANPYNRHFEAPQIMAALQPYVLRPMTWAVLIWEVAFGGFVLVLWLREMTGRRMFPDLRRWFLGFGVLMHLGIQAMLYVAWFTPLALASYAAFLRPAEARRLIDRLRRPGHPAGGGSR
ncbi:MAG: HTTM domain-containing protein [Myxococcales bacterium]|nr:HTTM domain-containing protein [Myxococcales bacterium]